MQDQKEWSDSARLQSSWKMFNTYIACVQAILYNFSSCVPLHMPLSLLPSSPFLPPSTSTDGIDFRPVNIDLAFNADDSQRCFTLHIIDDHQPEPVERLTLNLFKLGGEKAVIGQQGQLTVQISDDDSESMHWKCVKGYVVRVKCGESVYVRMYVVRVCGLMKD